MPRSRPQLSITLPRNFTFHYTEGEEPKTPEQETTAPVPQSPHAYRVKRRIRPSISLTGTSSKEEDSGLSDVPIPTIETPISVEPIRPPFRHQLTEPADGYLAPTSSRRFMTSPRTPSVPGSRLDVRWGLPREQSIGENISRPMSACSIMSDSSDDSSGSLSSYPSLGGSCTSPESDAPDPFTFPSFRKGRAKPRGTIADMQTAIKKSHAPKQNQVYWTPEMDIHLWTTYLIYLQDPTVTPFKMLPGSAPPLGVCHRVAREARRTWRGAKSVPRKSSKVSNTCNSSSDIHTIKPGGSPDTIKADRSGSNTPTGFIPTRPCSWPKSGSSTRRRLRELCKRKPTIAPHYQRLLQARSSSPESSGSGSQAQSLLNSSPFGQLHQQTPFNTRDIKLSLTTSTATSMQPDGPLAQLASRGATASSSNRDWFNDPIVPWASPTEIPSDIGLGIEDVDESMDVPQLGSPFGRNTWGPSRSRQDLHPSASTTHSDAVLGPALRSPLRFHDTFPYPSIHKRRAQHQLEDELSPGGTDLRKTFMEDLFGGPSESRHRRVRSRGFSLGDVNANGGRLESMFTPPSAYDEMTTPEFEAAAINSGNHEQLPSISDSVKRLGSPFAGVSARPPRRSSRHMASASLSAYDLGNFSSIDQTLVQANLDDDLKKRLGG